MASNDQEASSGAPKRQKSDEDPSLNRRRRYRGGKRRAKSHPKSNPKTHPKPNPAAGPAASETSTSQGASNQSQSQSQNQTQTQTQNQTQNHGGGKRRKNPDRLKTPSEGRGPAKPTTVTGKPNLGPARRRPQVIAAIDLGTNNCRLLVAQVMKAQDQHNKTRAQGSAHTALRSGQFRITDAFSRIVRLGEGLSSTGRLSEDAMSRTIAALKICANKVKKAQPIRIDAVATEACRQADNGAEFLARVKREIGIDLRIISGHEEAELALKSCVPLVDIRAEIAVVFDIGGGSTEVSVVPVPNLKRIVRADYRKHPPAASTDPLFDSISAPVGVVTFSERMNAHTDPAEAYQQMRAEVSEHFRSLANEHNLKTLAAEGKLCVIGTGGTITTLKALQLGLRSYDRSRVDATVIDRQDWEQVIADLSAMPADQRAMNGCIGHGRADLVLPGCAIMEGMLDLWPADRVGVADRGLREGLLVTMMNSIHRRQARRRRWRGAKRSPAEN